MPSPGDPKTRLQAALERVDLPRICAQLVRYASRRAGSRDLGRELAQKTLADAIDPDRSPWDPDRDPDLAYHLIGRVNGALAIERKKERLREHPTVVSAIEDRFQRPPPTPEAALVHHETREHGARLWRALCASFEADGDALGRKVLDQYADGNEDAAGQAHALRVDVRDVYDARRRIARRARALRDERSGQHDAVAPNAPAEKDDEVGT